MVDSIRTLIDTVVIRDTLRVSDTVRLLQPNSWLRDALPYVGALAAITASLVAAWLAYAFNKRMLKYSIAHSAFLRIQDELRPLMEALHGVSKVADENRWFWLAVLKQAPGGSAATGARDDFDPQKFVQQVRTRCGLLADRLEEAAGLLRQAADGLQSESIGQTPILPSLKTAFSHFVIGCCRFLDDVNGLTLRLRHAAQGSEGYPLKQTRSDVHDAGKEVTAGIANVNRWYGQLQDLLAAEAYKGLRMKTLLPQRHPSGDPNSLQLTREGFKTARVLGWYDPKLNRSTEKDAG